MAHKAGNYLLDDVIAESNLYSGFPIMQFISLETGLAWRNNGSSSSIEASPVQYTPFPLLLSYFFYFFLSSSSSFAFVESSLYLSTVSPHSFSPLHLYGCYYHLLASTQFINTLHSAFPLEIYFIIIFTPVLSAVVSR